MAACPPQPLFTGHIDLLLLPENLRANYDEPIKTKLGGDKIQIGLMEGYKLLINLGLPKNAVEELSKKLKSLNNYLMIRNYSILAHGFIPVERVKADEFYQYAVEITQIIERAEKLRSYVDCPQFPSSLPEKLYADIENWDSISSFSK
ncbi:hypothetical protein [Methylomusa anaerophila]|uniref:hypothetical protein n=1 Tax=Methylomusa anaerophila TaxID=1930071 RepID=UPI0013150FB2|nr:hypothetical protein [Methylomusa anaerophila]